MVSVAVLQGALFDMQRALDSYGDGWIITVFPDDDDRIHGSRWVETRMENSPPIMYMSDDLYALYCASIGMKNEHQRQGTDAT